MSPAYEAELRRPSAKADAWGRYYTPNDVSLTLVNAMTGVRPKLVIELGAGDCSLASAAHRKWKNASFVTVDTDLAAGTSLARSATDTAHFHYAYDALDDELAERIGVSLGSVDVGLCNPPYVRPRWRVGFGRILEEAGLSGALKSVHDAGADLLFIAQNLRLLRRSGKLGLILPDGLITGEKFRGVREVLLREHRVESVVQLPRSVFEKTEAQTYLLVMSKRDGETQSVQLSRMNDAREICQPISIPADLARTRLDFAYHASKAMEMRRRDPSCVTSTVGTYALDLLRGMTTSSEICSSPVPVFHLGDFPEVGGSVPLPLVPPSFILPKDKAELLRNKFRVAEAGDILIARIGRNLHKKVCYLPRDTCLISDCVFAVRVSPERREPLLAYLISEDGRAALGAASHGVGAKYISRSDVLELNLPF